jgi:hypothetical protein
MTSRSSCSRLAWTIAVLAVAFGVSSARAGETKAQDSKTKAPDVKSTDAKSPDAKKPETKFMRVIRDKKDRPLALETATGHYVSTSKGKPVAVDLIGAIHVADKKYYADLNKRFKLYDAVLFELVAPEGQSLEGLGQRKSNHPVAQIQQALPDMLKLEFQLKEIDYTPKNFVHADLSPDEMAKAMKARGETGLSVVFKVMFDIFNESSRQSAARAQKGDDFPELQLLAALFDSNRPLALKRLMADQMEMLGTGSGLGPTLDVMLVQDRNDAAMRVLSREIEKGTRKIAVFYGAAHMPDFDRRLTEKLNLKRESLTWDRAWDLSGK